MKLDKMNYYQVKARLERVDADGAIKATSEVFLVRAASFGQAEAAIMQEVASYATGDVDVVAIARKNYKEIITDKFGIESRIDGEARRILGQKNASTEADKWFKCKLNFITLNERSGKEKKTAHLFLVNANTALTAHELVDNFMRGSGSDYEVEQVDETKILEVFKVASKDEE